MKEQWVCPKCNFPENFLEDCAACGYNNPDTKPETEEQTAKYQ